MDASNPTCNSSILRSLLPTNPLGMQPSVGVRPTPEQLIATENEIRDLWNDGHLPFLTHLEGSVDGSYEQFMCDFFHTNVKPSDWVCASHRCHFAYQLHGGRDLVEQVKRGRSMFLYGPKFINSAIVAGVAPIAVGLALGIQRKGGDEKVFCFGGDGQENHGHWMEAVIYSWQKRLPITWIITDNDSSCGVTKEGRNGSDRLMQWPGNVIRFSYTPRFPHAGSGQHMTLKRTTL